MTYNKSGILLILINGLGIFSVFELNLWPSPPASITTFIESTYIKYIIFKLSNIKNKL